MIERKATVAIIGGGGRESVLAQKYSQSPHVKRIIAIPGNDMMQEVSEKKVVTFPGVKTSDVETIRQICRDNRVHLADIAEDQAVAAGATNTLESAGIFVVGPTKEAGYLESDKVYGRQIAEFAQIQQPNFKAFGNIKSAEEYLSGKENRKWFIKAAGLAEGKGVISADTKEEAIRAIKKLQKRFPVAARNFLIEEGIIGEELSAFYALDGNVFVNLGFAQDHKRALDGDHGENTGGMGTVSNPILAKNIGIRRNLSAIVEGTQTAQTETGAPYKGILFVGAMIDEARSKVNLLEYNARWGDPEAQVIIPGIQTDFFELGMAIAKGELRNINITTDKKVRVAVAGVSKGYPNDYSKVKGLEITGINEAKKEKNVTIYGANVKVNEGHYYANGGRLFYVVGEGANVIQARKNAYNAMSYIKIEGKNLHYRKDIGWRDVERIKNSV